MGNNKYKILIVEDEANIRSFIRANLETSDYQVLCAETCSLGMMMYASHRPDLIILDLGLPDRDGLDLIREVRKSDALPVIVLSARSNERDKVEALDLGANDYITKPFGTEELLARIRAVSFFLLVPPPLLVVVDTLVPLLSVLLSPVVSLVPSVVWLPVVC